MALVGQAGNRSAQVVTWSASEAGNTCGVHGRISCSGVWLSVQALVPVSDEFLSGPAESAVHRRCRGLGLVADRAVIGSGGPAVFADDAAESIDAFNGSILAVAANAIAADCVNGSVTQFGKS